MIAMDILAALWKRKSFIALFVSVALLACHAYILRSQTYTASVYIKYLEESAADGITTNGSKLDPYEIAEPFIVSKALEQLGKTNANANSVAQRIKVTPVNSNAEQQKYASWVDQFSNYENTEEDKVTPVYYRLEFSAAEGIQFSKAFLSALIQQYRSFYAERYSGFCEVAIIPKSTVLNADYFYAVELLQTQIENTRSYLTEIVEADFDYRSSETGYSLKDLIDAYDFLLETRIAPVTQYILDTGVSKDILTLTAELQQSADTAQRSSDENAAKADTQKEMMLLYAEKNHEYVSSVISPGDYDNQIYGDVERDKNYVRNFSTYDQMMLDYVSYATESRDLLIDKAYINANLEKFSVASTVADEPLEDISSIYDQYAFLMEITGKTLDGYNEVKAGRVVLQASGVRITQALPGSLYYTVSVILAAGLSCCLIVIEELKKLTQNNGKKEQNSFNRPF